MHLFNLNILFNIGYLLATYGYAGTFVVVFLESGVFFFLPGDSLLFTAGLLASASSLNLYILIPLIFTATFLGGLAGYGIGRYIETLHSYPIIKRILKPEYIAEAHRFFERHGKAAILISRFVPLMRTFTPIAAGVARMSFPSFVRYSLISSLLWSVSITLLGFFLGQTFPQIKDNLSYFIIGIVVISLLPAFVHWLRMQFGRRGTR